MSGLLVRVPNAKRWLWGVVEVSCRIRKATDCDIDCLAAIKREADSPFPEGRINVPGDTYPREGLIGALRDELLFVGEVGKTVAGFAVAGEAEQALHLYLLAVHPGFGRRGIGWALVVRVIEESAQRQLNGVTLTTFGDLPWNGPFYRKLGFRILASDELNPTLACILLREASAGLKRRVAMAYRHPS